jgi:hypothetical protein
VEYVPVIKAEQSKNFGAMIASQVKAIAESGCRFSIPFGQRRTAKLPQGWVESWALISSST